MKANSLVGKFYRIIDGKVDARIYNGLRQYHAVCNHCHGHTAAIQVWNATERLQPNHNAAPRIGEVGSAQ